MTLKFVCEDLARMVPCSHCGTSFDRGPKQVGRYRTECSEACRDERQRQQNQRYRQEGRYKERERAAYWQRSYRRTCVMCRVEFETKWNGAVCCGPACVKARKREARAIQMAATAPKPQSMCEACGERFLPARASPRQKAAGYVQRCCSRECASSLRPKALPKPLRLCCGCGASLSGRATKWCGKACEPKRPPRAKAQYQCRVCGATFAYVKTGGMPKTTCSPRCAAEQKLEGARVGRAIRRAREKAARVEAVSPTRVFERDGWRCQQCRRPTPKKLRGMMVPNAPELDHIVPLAAGGEHSYRNTQCLCRACNGAKSDGPGGQMRLFG